MLFFLERIENYLWIEVSIAYLFISKVIILLMHFISVQLKKIKDKASKTEILQTQTDLWGPKTDGLVRFCWSVNSDF